MVLRSLFKSRFLLWVLVILLVVLPLQAQDEAATEPAIPPTETTLPVEAPTDTPVATEAPIEPAPTVEVTAPTEEATAIPTEEATAAPTDEATAIPTEEATSAPTDAPTDAPVNTPAPLPLAYSVNFDAGYPAELTPGAGWQVVTVSDGQALQYVDGAQDSLYNAATFADTVIEASVLLNSGDVRLMARQSATGAYSAVLSADGTLKLLKNGELVNAGVVTLTPGTWTALKLSVVGSEISASINGVSVVAASDFAPLPAGQNGFGAAPGALVRLDNLAIYGAAAGVPDVVTAPVIVPDAPLPTEEATAEATLPPISGMSFDDPTGLNQTGSTQTSISLEWVSNSDEATSFRIERRLNHLNWYEIGSTVSTETSFTDSTMVCGQTADYRVRAFRSSDSSYTGYSNIITGSTPTCTNPPACNPDSPLIRVSTGSNGVPQNTTGALGGLVSDNGAYVMFMSDSDNLVPGDTNGLQDAFRYNRLTCQVDTISTGNLLPPPGYTLAYEMSADGNLVAFHTTAALVPEDTNGLSDVYVKNMTTGVFQRVSVNGATQGNGHSTLGSISPDGRYVAFSTLASNLSLLDTLNNCDVDQNGSSVENCRDVYLFDRTTGTLTLVSINSAGTAGGAGSSDSPLVLVAADKVYVAFESDANDIAGSNSPRDVFVRDVTSGVSYLASRTSSSGPIVSGDSHMTDFVAGTGSVSDYLYVMFTNLSSLINQDTNNQIDLYRRTMQISNPNFSAVEPLSLGNGVTPAAGPNGNGSALYGTTDSAGRYAFFVTMANNMVAGDTNGQPDFFRRDLTTYAVTRLTANEVIVPNYESISPSGGWIAFSSPEALVAADTNLTCTGGSNCVDTFLMQGLTLFNAPGNIQVSNITNTGVTVSWTDNSNVETGFQLQRTTDGGNTWTLVATIPAASGSGSTVSYNVTGLTCGQALTYRVMAIGTGGSTTAPSSTITTFTPACVCNSAGVVQMASISSGGTQGTGATYVEDAVVSADGRYTAFATARQFLASGDSEVPTPASDVFRFDRQTCTTILLSVSTSGTPLPSSAYFPAISGDGNLITFESNSKIYMRNVSAGTTDIVSRNTAGAEANSSSSSSAISADGRYVAFWSAATNLVANDTNGTTDVFVRDLQTNTTTRVSIKVDGNQQTDGVYGRTAISADGRYIAFTTNGNFGYAPDTQNADIYVRDTVANTTTLASRKPDGTSGSSTMSYAAISNTGRVVFTTNVKLLPQDNDTLDDVYVYDMPADTLILASVRNEMGLQTNGDARMYANAISADGRYVAMTFFDNLPYYPPPAVEVNIPGPQVWVRDLTINRTALVSRNATGNYAAIGNGTYTRNDRIAISADGNYFVYISEAKNLGGALCTGNCEYAFVTTRPVFLPFEAPTNLQVVSTTTTAATIQWTDNTAYESDFRVERLMGDNTWANVAFLPAISSYGTTGTFTETGLVCGSTFTYRVRAYLRFTGFTPYSPTLNVTTQPCTSIPPCPLLSALTPIIRLGSGVATFAPGNGAIYDYNENLISGSGRYTVFSTDATGLVPNSPNDHTRIAYRYDRTNCTIEAVAVDGGGVPVQSLNPSISADGNFVAFETDAALVAGDTNNHTDVYVRDMTVDTYERVSITETVAEPDNDSFVGAISDDGRYVAFLSLASNIIPGIANPDVCYDADTGSTTAPCADVYLYDTQTDTVSAVSIDPTATSFGDGQTLIASVVVAGGQPYVIYSTYASNQLSGDTINYCESDLKDEAPGTPDPDYDYDENCFDIFLRRVTGVDTGSTFLVSRSMTGGFADNASLYASISADTTNIYISLASAATNLTTGVTVPQYRTYLRTIPISTPGGGTTTLISRASGVAGAIANNFSGFSVVSDSGRYIAFESDASNLVAGDTNNRSDVFVRDRVLNTTTRVSMNGVTQLNSDSFLGSMTAGGLYIAFTSDATNVPALDGNNVCETDFADADDNNQPGIQGDGNENCPDMFMVTVPGTALGAPGALTATVNLATSINLSWAAINGVTEYRVERNTGSGFVELPGAVLAGTTTFSDTGYLCGTTGIQYRVRGYRSADSSFTAYTNTATGGTLACAAPLLTGPVSGFQAQGNVNLQWSSVLNSGNNYRVWIATDAAFTNVVAGYPQTVTGLAYPIATLPDGTYSWKVQAYNTAPVTASGPFSLVRTFVIDTVAPTASPMPLTPVNNNTVTTERPVFTWAASAGAAFYQLEINDDSTFTNAAEYTSPGIPGAPAATTFTIPNTAFLPQGDYFWRVRALDAAGNTGPYSALTPKFTVSLMSTPASNGIVTVVAPASTAPVTFTWMTVVGATGYRVQVDDDSSFGSIDRTCIPVPATALTCTLSATGDKLPAGIYYWRVIVDGQPLTGTHPYRKFTVSPTAPAMPVVLAPAANVVYSDFSTPARNAASFSWTPVVGLTYTLEIASTAAFTTAPLITVSGLTTSPYVTDLTSLGAGTFYWRLKAVNAVGVNSVPSAARALIVDLQAPPVPGLTLPADLATVNMVRPALTWGAVTDPAAPVKYRVDISQSSDFSSNNVYTDTLVSAPTFTPPTNLPAQGDYYWRVQSVDAAGNASNESLPRKFTVNISNTPAANAVMMAGNIAFTWAAVPTATGYKVEIERGGVPDFIAPDITCPNAGTTTLLTCTVPAATMTTGTYFWRVVATSVTQPVTNDTGTYRALYLGTTAALPAPTNVHLDAVSGTGVYDTDIYINAAEKPGGVNLVWNAPTPVTGLTVSQYVIEFSPVTTFIPITQTLTSGTTSVAVPASMTLADGTNKYARVRAVYGTASSANTPSFWFVVDTAAQPVPAPITSPSMVFSTLKPMLSWSAVTGIAATNGYRIFAEGIHTANITVANNLPTTTPSYTFPANLAQGIYRWSVQSVDAAGNFSAMTPLRFFQVNLGTQPAPATFTADTTPTFTWAAVPGYVGTYRLLIDTNFGLPAPFLNQVVTGTSYTLTDAQVLTPGAYYWRVERTVGETPAPLLTGFIQMAVTTPPPVPVLTTPPNLDVINALEETTTNLAWLDVSVPPGVSFVQYHVEYSPTNVFTNPASVALSSPQLGLASLALPDGVWYWRVAALYSGATTFSASRSFTLDTVPAAVPGTLNVTFGANPSRPTLTWGAVAGIAATNGYQIDLLDSTLAQVSGFPKTSTTPSLALTANLPQGAYQFRVRSVDAAGNPSANSTPFPFVVNVANMPAANGVVNAPAATVNQVFTWFAVPGATSYKVEVDADGNFNSGALSCPASGTTTLLTCTLPGLPRGTYVWRVVVNGVTPPAVVKRTLFVLNAAALPVPGLPNLVELTSPAPYQGDNLISASEKASNVDVTWSAPAVLGATIVSYDIQYAANATFTPVLDNALNVFGLSDGVNFGMLPGDGIRYVRVRANYALPGGGALPGPFTAAKLFTVDTIAPAAPLLTAPKGGLIVVTRTPALTFAASLTATKYVVEVATSNTFGGTTVVTGTVTTPTFTVPGAQGLVNGVYFWRVTPFDAAGNPGPTSTVADFVVNAP